MGTYSDLMFVDGTWGVVCTEDRDGDVQWFNVYMLIFVEPGAQVVQEGGEGTCSDLMFIC